MEFEECVNRLFELAWVKEEGVSTRMRQLALEVSKCGISGLVPLDEGGTTDGVPITEILALLQVSMEQVSNEVDRQAIEALYADLVSEGVEGYTLQKTS